MHFRYSVYLYHGTPGNILIAPTEQEDKTELVNDNILVSYESDSLYEDHTRLSLVPTMSVLVTHKGARYISFLCLYLETCLFPGYLNPPITDIRMQNLNLHIPCAKHSTCDICEVQKHHFILSKSASTFLLKHKAFLIVLITCRDQLGY